MTATDGLINFVYFVVLIGSAAAVGVIAVLFADRGWG